MLHIQLCYTGQAVTGVRMAQRDACLFPQPAQQRYIGAYSKIEKGCPGSKGSGAVEVSCDPWVCEQLENDRALGTS